MENLCRTPQGVRGLKLNTNVFMNLMLVSHSARSAWIETLFYFLSFSFSFVALRKECVD